MNTFNVTVTHTLHPDVLQVLANLFQGASNVQNGKKVNGSKKEVAKELPAATTTTDESPAPSVTPAATISIEQLRSLVQTKAQAGKRDEIKKILGEFGADKVTSLQENQYADFHEKINAL
jgi:hypothetical protein